MIFRLINISLYRYLFRTSFLNRFHNARPVQNQMRPAMRFSHCPWNIHKQYQGKA